MDKFELSLREDRPATIEEHHKLRVDILHLKAVLSMAKAKLMLYRNKHSGEYIGGVEYTILIRLIDEAL